jgi:hypothetical protein
MIATGPKECPNNMETVTQVAIIGIDVSRAWLDIHILPSNCRKRLPNTDEGHERLNEMARCERALVCFVATGGPRVEVMGCIGCRGDQNTAIAASANQILCGEPGHTC